MNGISAVLFVLFFKPFYKVSLLFALFTKYRHISPCQVGFNISEVVMFGWRYAYYGLALFPQWPTSQATDTSINTAPAERNPQVSVTAAEGSRQSREVKAIVVLIHCAMSLMSTVYFRIKSTMKNKKDEWCVAPLPRQTPRAEGGLAHVSLFSFRPQPGSRYFLSVSWNATGLIFTEVSRNELLFVSQVLPLFT